MTTYPDPQLNDSDLELLSAYIDQQLTAADRATLEQRLEHEPALQLALEELRTTVGLLRELPAARPPRSFALDPRSVAPKRSWSFPWMQLGSALVAATLLLVFGFVLTRGTGGGGSPASAPMAASAPTSAPAAAAPTFAPAAPMSAAAEPTAAAGAEAPMAAGVAPTAVAASTSAPAAALAPAATAAPRHRSQPKLCRQSPMAARRAARSHPLKPRLHPPRRLMTRLAHPAPTVSGKPPARRHQSRLARRLPLLAARLPTRRRLRRSRFRRRKPAQVADRAQY